MLHAQLRPRNYLEIGVNDGRSLALSRVPSIAVDPAFRITVPIRCDVHLVKETSDDFFAREDPIRHLRSSRDPRKNLRRGRPPFGAWIGKTTVDLAFIDGLHLFEFALRDFINLERASAPSGTLLIHDCYPLERRSADRAGRNGFWSGDIWRLILILKKYRPDLMVRTLGFAPTGLGLVRGLDPASTLLADRYDAIVAEFLALDYAVLDDDKAGQLNLFSNQWEDILPLLQ